MDSYSPLRTSREDTMILHCRNCGWVDDARPIDWLLVDQCACNCGHKPSYILYEAGVEDSLVAEILDKGRQEGRRVRFRGNPLMAGRSRSEASGK